MIEIVREGTQEPAKSSGSGCSVIGVALTLLVVGAAHWMTAGIESPIFWIGWIIFWLWARWFLVNKCGWPTHP